MTMDKRCLQEGYYFSNFHRSAIRDIYPRWAQSQVLDYSFAPSMIKFMELFCCKKFILLSRIPPNHGIKIRLEFDLQDPGKYLYDNRVSYPRGYYNMISIELELYSVDYVIPLAYPDLTVSSLLYLKRIRTGLFYDYGTGTGNYYFENSGNGQTLVHIMIIKRHSDPLGQNLWPIFMFYDFRF